MVSPQCDFCDVFQGSFLLWKPHHTGCFYMASPQYWFSGVFQDFEFDINTLAHWLHCYGYSLVWVLWYILRHCFIVKAFTLAAFIWLLPSVSSHMYFKTPFYCKSFITLAAFIWLLHNVSYLILFKWTHRNH